MPSANRVLGSPSFAIQGTRASVSKRVASKKPAHKSVHVQSLHTLPEAVENIG